ncbi:MAG: HU family DNA-binding protein [Patescibacteria group bacterium]
MNKVGLAEKLVEKTGLPKQQVENLIDSMLEIITQTLKSGGEVALTGFGAFTAKRREARMGVDPRNPSQKIQIPAVTVPKFKAGKNLKDALKEQ